jgi:hypothetical protein
VTSVFVNRLQFEAGGDFDRYPRTFPTDCAKLEKAGAHVVFAPDEREMYPAAQEIAVTPPKVAEALEGEHRPGHFQGVATVVAKLFNIVAPDAAVFGKKDYQQLRVIRELVRQLNFGIEIVAAETIREPDGLAMSSRNGYLTREERARPRGCSRSCGASATGWRRAKRTSSGSPSRPKRSHAPWLARRLRGVAQPLAARPAGPRRPRARASRGGMAGKDAPHRQPRGDAMTAVLVSEVGPRDGLQSVKAAMPTEAKHRWIRALAGAGLREIEVASFVPAKLLPQMADAAEVVHEAVKIPGLTVLALAPNLKGVENAAAGGRAQGDAAGIGLARAQPCEHPDDLRGRRSSRSGGSAPFATAFRPPAARK